jgi:hypothetical protein
MNKLSLFLAVILSLFYVGDMQAASRLVYPIFKGWSTAGKPLSGGLLYTYEPGTTTPKASYTTADGSVSLSNPVVLDSLGEKTIFLSGKTKVVLKTSTGSTLWTEDSVEGTNANTDTASLADKYSCNINNAITAIEAAGVETNLIVDCAATMTSGSTVATTKTNLIGSPIGSISGIAGGASETLVINGKVISDWQVFGNNLVLSYTTLTNKIKPIWASTFANTLTAVGTINKATLLIDSTTTLTSNVTVTPNITLERSNTGLFTGAFTLTINGGLTGDMTSQWFASNVIVAGVHTVNPHMFGAKGDGVTDDTAAVTRMFNQAGAYSTINFLSGKNYLLTSVACKIQYLTTVIAYGATLTGTTEAVMFDLNSDITPQTAQFRWKGGLLINIAGKTSSVGIKVTEFRDVVIKDARFDNFYKAILVTDRDTFTIKNNHFYGNVRAVCLDETLSIGNQGLLISVIEENHFSITGAEAGIYVDGLVLGVRISKNSFNGAATNSIFISSEHAGQAIRGVSIKENHFEQGTIGKKYIYLTDGAGTNTFLGTEIEGNTFGDGPASAVTLERCMGVNISANTFAQTVANGGASITIDALCTRIAIDGSNFFSTANIAFSCAREEILFKKSFVSTGHTVVTGYNGDSFSSSSATIDMSAAVSTIFPTSAGIVPKGWLVNVQARDSGSAASVTARVDLDSSLGSPLLRCMVRLAGVPNDLLTGAQFYVPANADGDIAVNVIATGTNTTDIYLVVLGYYM